MSLPLAASGPVSGMRKTILMVIFWAGARPGLARARASEAATITASGTSLRMGIFLGGRSGRGSESQPPRAWHSARPDARLRPPDQRRHADDEIAAPCQLGHRPDAS